MTPSHHDLERHEDAAPVDMLAALFEARGWPFEFAGEDEITGEIQGSWANYTVRGIWRREDHVLQLLCLPDVRITDDKRPAVYELLGQALVGRGAKPLNSRRSGYSLRLPSGRFVEYVLYNPWPSLAPDATYTVVYGRFSGVLVAQPQPEPPL